MKTALPSTSSSALRTGIVGDKADRKQVISLKLEDLLGSATTIQKPANDSKVVSLRLEELLRKPTVSTVTLSLASELGLDKPEPQKICLDELLAIESVYTPPTRSSFDVVDESLQKLLKAEVFMSVLRMKCLHADLIDFDASWRVYDASVDHLVHLMHADHESSEDQDQQLHSHHHETNEDSLEPIPEDAGKKPTWVSTVRGSPTKIKNKSRFKRS